MTNYTKYASFLVRLWLTPGQDTWPALGGWRSEVEHIQSGKSWSFGTLEELEGFLRRQVNDPGQLEWIELQEDKA